MKKLLIVLCLFSVVSYSFAFEGNIKFVPGSNIYIRIFLFYFPLSQRYTVSVTGEDSQLNASIHMNRDVIHREPIHELEKARLFDTDLMIHVREIPLKRTGYYTLPVTFRMNRKIVKRNVEFKVVSKKNILVVKGKTELLLGEINDSEYYHKRSNWRYPFYFDLRFQLSE